MQYWRFWFYSYSAIEQRKIKDRIYNLYTYLFIFIYIYYKGRWIIIYFIYSITFNENTAHQSQITIEQCYNSILKLKKMSNRILIFTDSF